MNTSEQLTILKKYADYFLTNNQEVMSKEMIEELQAALQLDETKNTLVDTTELKVIIFKSMLDVYVTFYKTNKRFMTFDEFDSLANKIMSIESVDEHVMLAAYEFTQDSMNDCIDEYIPSSINNSDELLLKQCDVINSALIDAFDNPGADIIITVGDKTGFFYDRAVLVDGLMKVIGDLAADLR